MAILVVDVLQSAIHAGEEMIEQAQHHGRPFLADQAIERLENGFDIRGPCARLAILHIAGCSRRLRDRRFEAGEQRLVILAVRGHGKLQLPAQV
jgi:hypothetical protein